MHPLFLIALSLATANAQQRACPSPDTPQQVTVTGKPYVPQGVRLNITIETCPQETEPPPPPDDILHGDPAPQGLLRGEGPANLLTNRPKPKVTVHESP